MYEKPRQRKPRSLEERIAAIKSKNPRRDFLDAEPRPGEHTVSLARYTGTSDEDWARRKRQHVAFLETTESLSVEESFYRIRYYIQEQPHICAGRWHDDPEHPDFGYWVWGPGAYECSPNWLASIEKTRTHLINVFREILGDAPCPHGESWDVWQHKSWDKNGSAGCARCFLPVVLKENNKPAELANFPDAKIARGNTKSANTILNLLGLGKWSGKDKHETYHDNLTQIDNAGQRDELIGGKKVGPEGLGPDSSDRSGDDKSAGSQDNSRTASAESSDKFDKRKIRRLPGFDSLPAETHDGEKPLKEQVPLKELVELEEDE
jgi:hypothetical protein